MKKLIVLVIATVFSSGISAQIYMAKTCEISFFSKTPMKDIDATNKAAKPLLNTATGDIQIKIVMTAFVFPDAFMQEHFNENYIESEKYPNCIFKGKVNEKVDYTKDGENKVTVTGTIDMHGVKKDVTLEGTITVKGNEITMSTKFRIHIADYNIKVPSLYVETIAENVDCKLDAVLEPFKKN
jgi:polyisoprenoid-binding protein YceI